MTTPAATELGHATRVMAANSDFRFVPGLGWLSWDGTKWATDAEGALMAVVHGAAERYHSLAPGSPLSQILTSRRGLEDVAVICRDIPGVRISVDQLDQCHGHLHASGVTWDLQTGAAAPTLKSELNTRSLAIEPAAGCPRWLQFLDECFPNEPDMPLYLQRLIGYGLTGEASAQAFVIMQGAGGNGKSVFIDALTHAFRPYVVHLPVQVLMSAGQQKDGEGASPQLMRLRGARLVFTSESDREGRLDEAKVKLLTGGDEISLRGLYSAAVTFRPEALIMMATNHLPEIRGTDRGIWRRVKVVEWRESFEGREDRHLSRTLREEAAGIVNWALEGALDWYARGEDLAEPPRVAAAAEAYQHQSDFFGSFIPDWLIADDSAWMSRSDVVTVWEEYTDASGGTHLRNNRTLFAALRERNAAEAGRKGVPGFRVRRVGSRT